MAILTHRRLRFQQRTASSIDTVEFTPSQDTSQMHVMEDEFRELLEEAQAGSQDAMRGLIELCAPHIVRTVRRKLHRSIRAKFDSIDFVQAVWASFFAASTQFSRFDCPEALTGYLATMAHNKVVDEIRRRMKTEKYNVNRERSLDDSNLHAARHLAAQGPSPSEVVLANELWARLIERQPEHYRRILELRRSGNTQQQIADQLGLSERTVRRVIQRILDEQMA